MTGQVVDLRAVIRLNYLNNNPKRKRNFHVCKHLFRPHFMATFFNNFVTSESLQEDHINEIYLRSDEILPERNFCSTYHAKHILL